MTAALPLDTGVESLIVEALKALLTSACQTGISTGDVSRAALIKIGPRQAAPESVSIMVHEGDPDKPDQWPHKPQRMKQGGDSSLETRRASTNLTFIGGGSLQSMAFLLEIEVFGLYFPDIGATVEREDVAKVAAVVANRAIKAIMEAGPKIGTGARIEDSFGKKVVDGPYLGDNWVDPETGEALLVRKFVKLWYKVASSWSTDAW